MTYESCGESGQVHRIVMLAVPEGGDHVHLDALAPLARMLMDEESVAALEAATSAQEVVDVMVSFARSRTRAAPDVASSVSMDGAATQSAFRQQQTAGCMRHEQRR